MLTGSIVGSWAATNYPPETSVFTFVQDGTFMGVSASTGGTGPNTDGTPGMERGTYSLDLNTGNLTMTILVDTNGHWGASDKNPIGATYVVPITTLNSDLFIAGGKDTWQLVASPTSPIVGTWYIAKGQYHVAMTFKADGTYLQAEDGPADGSSGHSGMDTGTYTWNPTTGAFTCTTLAETDGGWSLANAHVVSLLINGDTAVSHSTTEGDNTATRVIASHQAPTTHLIGTEGNDTLNGGAGNDTLNGGAGIDIAVYSNIRSHYTVTKTATGYTVQDTIGTDGTDTLSGVERLYFSDTKLALDTSGDAGQAYRLYQAAFNRTPDIGGLGFQMKALDDGWPLATVAQNFIDSPEFSATYGSLNTSAFVAQMYLNVLHRAGDPVNEIPWYATRIEAGAMSRAAVLVGFSESPENQGAVIGAIQNGMTYTL